MTDAGGKGAAQQAAAAASVKLQETMEAVKAKLPAGLTGDGGHDGPKDHQLYDTLGVAEDASKTEIRAAYSERKHEVWSSGDLLYVQSVIS